MPTSLQIQTLLLNAGLEVAYLVNTNLAKISIGNNFVQWGEPRLITRNIRALNIQYSMGDYTSVTTQNLYDCLNSYLGTSTATGTIDPNYQSPNTVINITASGSKVNSNQYPFSSQTTVALSGYQTAYYPLYGTNPYVQIFVSDGAGGFTPDYTTSPDYTYALPGMPSSGIASIVWNYAVPVSGYILISGVQP